MEPFPRKFLLLHTVEFLLCPKLVHRAHILETVSISLYNCIYSFWPLSTEKSAFMRTFELMSMLQAICIAICACTRCKWRLFLKDKQFFCKHFTNALVYSFCIETEFNTVGHVLRRRRYTHSRCSKGVCSRLRWYTHSRHSKGMCSHRRRYTHSRCSKEMCPRGRRYTHSHTKHILVLQQGHVLGRVFF